MNYTVFCQRCDRPAVQRKLENTRVAWIYSAATDRRADEVRLCAGCIKTIESLGFSVARAKRRKEKT